MSRTYPQSSHEVKGKEKEVMDAWISLKSRSESRKVKLADSHDLQKFLSDYRFVHVHAYMHMCMYMYMYIEV